MRISRAYSFLALSSFVLALLLPLIVTGWSITNERLRHENRLAANWPSFQTLRITSLREYFRLVERAFGDRIGFRDQLIYIHQRLQVDLLRTGIVGRVVFGRDGQLFSADDELVRDRIEADRDEAEILRISNEISRRYRFLSERSIDYLLLIAPDKSSVYRSDFPDTLAKPGASRLRRVLESVDPAVRYVVLDPTDALKGASSGARQYYRTDTHWTPSGSDTVYRLLLQRLLGREAAPLEGQLGVGRQKDTTGQLAYATGLPERFPEPFYHDPTSIDPEYSKYCTFDLQRNQAGRIRFAHATCAGRGDSRRLLVHRDSFFAPFLGPLAARHSDSVFVWTYRWDEDLIEIFAPNVVIDQVVERNLHQLVARGSSEGSGSSKSSSEE